MTGKILLYRQKPAFKEELNKIIYITFGAFTVVTIVRLTLSLDEINSTDMLLAQVFINFIFSLSITFSAVFTAHYFTDRLTKTLSLTIRLLLSFIAMVCSLIFGIYLGQFIVWIIGIATSPYFLAVETFWFSLMFSCIVAIVVIVYYGLKEKLERAYEKIKFQERQKSELEILKTKAELEALQSKINPHFLFNSLNSIAGLASIAPEKVEETILKLSELFRASIRENDTFSSIEDEIRLIENYLDIEKIRFGNRLEYTIKTDKDLYAFKIPHLLIQPLVENAIKHGIEPLTEGGFVNISIQKKDAKNIIEVKDSGVGMKGDISSGYGLTNIRKRLENLYKDNYSFNIESGDGTTVSITIPAE